MEDRPVSWRKQIIRHPVFNSLVALFITLVILVFLGGYLFHWDWTGINSQENKITTISTPQGTYRATEVQSEKNLWDWLQLLAVLAIPVVVGLGAAWYTEQQRKVSDRENTDNQSETALQAYIDNMSELLLDANRPLRESKPEDEVQTIARARTLTVLPRLDANRKGSVLLFLYESGLIYKDKFFIDLRAADLSKADLSKVDLSGANLSRANLNIAKLASADLRRADLSRADLSRAELRANLHLADLRGANLSGAELRGADLHGADLRGADLHGANLVSAVLIEADLREANLSGANVFRATVTSEQLEKAKSLKGTTMPDGSIHP
jgi:uncharacterized protein YjbI with pentapeptide repeats